MMTLKGRITNITRTSFHDGPGLRTVVYLKGCSLSCKWCHNPETILFENQMAYVKSRCIHCGRCTLVCPNNCHTIVNSIHEYSRENCDACGKCSTVCPNQALSQVSQQISIEEVFEEILKDKHYYDATNGGVTISGGECLLHPKFTAALLEMCKLEGIHTAVDSALCVNRESIDMVKDFTDLFLVDIKHHDSSQHKELTGIGNSLILDNLHYLASIHNNIWIRIPLIPGMNDSDENIIETARIINSLGRSIKRVELLRYNDLAQSKYEILGITPIMANVVPQSDAEMKMKADTLKSILIKEIQALYI